MNSTRLPEFYLIGIKIKTSNQNGQAMKDIPALWEQFMQADMPNIIPNKVDQNIYCAYTDYESDWQAPYTCFLGCKVSSLDELPEGMHSLLVPASDYFVKKVEQGLSGEIIANAWNEIWKSDLKRKYTVDFEVYYEESNQPDQAKLEIYIAI